MKGTKSGRQATVHGITKESKYNSGTKYHQQQYLRAEEESKLERSD